MKYLFILFLLTFQPLSEKTTKLILNNHVQHDNTLDKISQEVFTTDIRIILDSVDIDYEITSQIDLALKQEQLISKKHNKKLSIFYWSECTDKAYTTEKEYVDAFLQDLPSDVKFGYVLIVVNNTFKLYVLTSK